MALGRELASDIRIRVFRVAEFANAGQREGRTHSIQTERHTVRLRLVVSNESGTHEGGQAYERRGKHQAGAPEADDEDGPGDEDAKRDDATPAREEHRERLAADQPIAVRVLEVRGVDGGENDERIDELGG